MGTCATATCCPLGPSSTCCCGCWKGSMPAALLLPKVLLAEGLNREPKNEGHTHNENAPQAVPHRVHRVSHRVHRMSHRVHHVHRVHRVHRVRSYHCSRC